MTHRAGLAAANSRLRLCWIVCWLATAFVATSATVFAQTDEIYVYDANIAEVGISNHALVGVAERAYGVTDWFEQGLYLPLYRYSTNDSVTYNGFKLRWLFVKPHAAEDKFFYGVNFEFNVNQKQWDSRHFTSEVRPIIGWHLHPVDIIVNPIMGTSYTGGFKSLDFAPAIRVAYNLNPKWAVAAEEYADYGPLRQIYSATEQSHQIWARRPHQQACEYRSGHWIRTDQCIRQGDIEADSFARSQLIIPRRLGNQCPADNLHGLRLRLS